MDNAVSLNIKRNYKGADGKFISMLSLKDRFELLFIPVTESGCWIWLGHLNGNGYGSFRVSSEWLSMFPGVNKTRNKSKHVMVQAHRMSYAMHYGDIDPDLTIDHLCRVRQCVNPLHLEQVSSRENTLRGFSMVAMAARRNSCPYGHPYDEENLIVYRGQRMCRECRREAVRRMRQRRRNERAGNG